MAEARPELRFDRPRPRLNVGYVLKGAVHLKYLDGTVEVTGAGEVFYWPGGHTGWVEEDTVFIDFSPEKEFKQVAENMARVMGQSG